jgi:hypothetical protein
MKDTLKEKFQALNTEMQLGFTSAVVLANCSKSDVLEKQIKKIQKEVKWQMRTK